MPRCGTCQHFFVTPSFLEEHAATCRREERAPRPCGHCGQAILGPAFLARHERECWENPRVRAAREARQRAEDELRRRRERAAHRERDRFLHHCAATPIAALDGLPLHFDATLDGEGQVVLGFRYASEPIEAAGAPVPPERARRIMELVRDRRSRVRIAPDGGAVTFLLGGPRGAAVTVSLAEDGWYLHVREEAWELPEAI